MGHSSTKSFAGAAVQRGKGIKLLYTNVGDLFELSWMSHYILSLTSSSLGCTIVSMQEITGDFPEQLG